MKIGAIVGRFQVPKLHEGHKHLIDFALDNCDMLLLIMGVTKNLEQNLENPLSYQSRYSLIREDYPDVHKVAILSIRDQDDDRAWDLTLDHTLNHFQRQGHIVCLYDGRDGFTKSYRGHFPIVTIKTIENVSGTNVRQNLIPSHNYDYRVGVIDTINKLNK